MGLEFLPNGQLIGSANGDTEDDKIAVLISIDPNTGAGTLIGELGRVSNPGECGRIPDIAYDNASGNFTDIATFVMGEILKAYT